MTVFHEPINIRAENVKRIQDHVVSVGVPLKTEVFATRKSWQDYALNSLHAVERVAHEVGTGDRLHRWPDKSLGNQALVKRMPHPKTYIAWLHHWWNQ